MNLVVGKGVDQLIFGMGEKAVIAELGKPDKVYFADDGDRRLIYNGLRSSLWFCEDRLHWIICAHPKLEMFGRPLHGKATQDVLGFLKSRLDDTIDFEGYGEMESHTFDESWVELQFDYGVLDRVCFGHLFGEDDDPIWPVA